MDDSIILKELQSLIRGGNNLKIGLVSSTYLPSNINTSYYQKCEKWMGAALNILKLRFGVDSDYYQHFFRNISKKVTNMGGGIYYKENVGEATGVLEYVYEALSKGFTDDLFYKKEIIVLSDLLEQAFEFLQNNMKLAAAVYGRVVLETTIKEFAEKKGVSEKKFDQVIIKLRQQKIITKPFESSLRGNYQIGSDAVHMNQEFSKYTDNSIKEFLIFIRDKVLTLE